MKQLSALLEEYLEVRRALGAKLKQTEWLLRQFLAFLAQHEATVITIDWALKWACEPESASARYRYQRLAAVRKFSQYAQVADNRHQQVPPGLLPYCRRRPHPYIYTSDEILAVMNAAEQLPGCLRPATYATIVGLLSVTGMRTGEVVRLDRSDVDLQHGQIAIRNTKFGKSRMVLCHRSTQQMLCQYASKRDRMLKQHHCEAFFLNDRGMRISQDTLQYTFVQLSYASGLRKVESACKPRLHDLRHTYAVRTLMQWYRDDVDVESQLPHLATWLGHVGIGECYWYLSAVPELMHLVAQKLDHQQNRTQ